MKTSITKRGSDSQRSALTLVGVHTRRRLTPSAKALDEAIGGQLTRAMNGSAFEGEPGQTLMLHAPDGGPASRIALVGVGDRDALSGRKFQKALAASMSAADANKAPNVTSYLAEVSVTDRDGAWQLSETVQAAAAAAYRFDGCKSKDPVPSPLTRLKVSAPADCPPTVAQAAVHRVYPGACFRLGIRTNSKRPET